MAVPVRRLADRDHPGRGAVRLDRALPDQRADGREHQVGMRQSDRLDTILTRLSENGSVAVTGLAADLGVSMATIRRDLELLESQRLLSRTHGGAVSHGVLYELPLRYRSGRHEAEKRRGGPGGPGAGGGGRGGGVCGRGP